MIERAHANQAQRKSCLRNEPRLQAPFRSYKENLGAMARNQFTRHSESGEDVSPGASSGDQNPQRHSTPQRFFAQFRRFTHGNLTEDSAMQRHKKARLPKQTGLIFRFRPV
jgi:hypothetical protein